MLEVLDTLYPLFKALHIVGFVSWFAGLFYLVRMFVYHVESAQQPEPERGILTNQYRLMEQRVYRIICNPAMMITWTFGLLMLIRNGTDWLAANGWMHVKLLLLIGLTIYHLWTKKMIAKLAAGDTPYSGWRFRLLNEVPTLFLLSIALLAVYRNTLNFVYAFLGLIAFVVLLMIGAKAYKRAREKNPEA